MMRLLCFIFLVFSFFLHAEEELKQVSVLPSGSVYQGDYFSCGQNIEISGKIVGDTYVLGGQITVDGVIDGDLLVCGGSVDLAGKVQGNVRMLGGQLLISGSVEKNVSAVAGNILVLPCAYIGEGFVAAAGNIDVGAQIGGGTTLVASYARVASSIHSNLTAYIGQLRLTSKSHIGGDLFYHSESLAVMEEGAKVDGHIEYTPSLVQGWLEGTWAQKLLVGSKFIASVMNFLYSFVVGLILIKLFPDNLNAAVFQLQRHPLKTLIAGCVLLIALPLASLVLLMTILGVPFALTLIAANIIGFYTAKIYTIYFGAHFLAVKCKLHARRVLVLFTGLVVYFCLTAIPVFGTLLAFAAMLLGVGAGVRAQGITTHKN